MFPGIDPALLSPLLTTSRLGLVCDFDGSLSPIVPRPEDAQPTPANRAHLLALSARLPLVAVITGRAAEDAYRRIGVPGLLAVGNHGLERWQDDRLALAPGAERFIPVMRAAVLELAPLVPEGGHMEDKGVTLSLHFRRASDPDAARDALLPQVVALAERHGLALHEGRRIFEFRPPLALDKGTALTGLVEEFGLTGVVFFGDDVTDADAMVAARRLRAEGLCHGVGLGVTSDETPEEVLAQADGLLAGVSGVEDFLAWLSRSLSASAT